MAKISATPHTNRLAHETSPYLLQHAHNPVDWYPWGAEALDRARDENKLILLSIGYSACHWCHVMERESFEDASIASLMNEHFISIKVDREERPDLDDIYMAATVAMNQGQGGWPMTVFLTPTLEPVFAGTYFPPDDQHGRPGFRRLLTNIATAWRENREQVRQQAAHFTDQLRGLRTLGPALALGEEHLRLAGQQYAESFDAVFGGFGPAPKFPAAVSIMLLLRLHRRFGDDHLLQMATKTLDAMAQGGMYDHIGGGFARYSTDSRWLVPHFEKMLYDNALLARAYLEAFQVTEHDLYRRVATETLDYVLREMQSPDGGFYSSTDADSEGVEGKFFVWTPAEVEDVLGADDARLFNQHYDITDVGNWEGVSIPNTPRSLEDTASEFKLSEEDVQRRLDTARAKMYEARRKRVNPGLDDKILTSWNGLMISALAEGYRILGDTRYLEAATNAAAFVKRELSDGDGGLLRTYRAGTAHLAAYLEDYAYLSEALIDLFEAGGDPNHWTEAVRLVDRIIERFSGDGDGAFYHTANDHERLVMRFREGHDGATPAPNAVAASALTRLSYHLARDDYRNAAIRALTAYGRQVSQIPRGFAKTLTVVDFLLEGPIELVFVGRRGAPDLTALQREVAKTLLPNRIQATWDPTDARAFPESNRFRGTLGAPMPLPLLEGKVAVDGKATLYVCRNSTCEAPITDPSRVGQALATSPRSRTNTIAIRVSGRGTPTGTQRYAARYEGLGFGPLGNTDLRVRRIGIGTYRADEFTEAHREALVRALMSGVNLIDTSTNYMDGGSERLIGRTLAELIEAGDIRRDEIMVVSKIGYVQGANYTLAQERENAGRGFPEVVKITDGLWHCMHPEFLEDQLARSLDRLGLETLDTCLLHNPEYFLAHGDHGTMTIEAVREEFYRRVEAAFTFFEAQVSAGRVTWYGVSSNTAGFSEQDTEATSFTRLLAAAERAGGPSHHFRFLQVPMNLLETDPVFVKKDGPDAARTVLEAAAAAGVAVLTNRPLNAIARDHIVRLASVGVEEVEVDFDKQMESVRELERAFEDRLAPGIHVSGASLEPRQFFHWGTALGSVDVQALGIDQWEQVESQVRHSVGRITTILDQRLAGDTGKRWSDWRARYARELDLLLNGFRRRIARRMSDENAVFEAAIDPHLPENRRHEPLARKALWVVASTPGVSCVLNGMRTTAYVRDAIAVAEWDTLPDVVRVYEAVARALERE